MKQYRIETEVRGAERFLTVRQGQEENLNTYLLKMLENNTIAGVLSVRSQQLNGNTVLYYQVDKCFQVLSLIKKNQLDSDMAKTIYSRLVDAFLGMGEYFLNVNQCVYNVEHLYVDATFNPYLIYLPFEDAGETDINRVARLFLDLLSHLSAEKQDPFYDELMRYLIRPDFQLTGFQEILNGRQVGADSGSGYHPKKQPFIKPDPPISPLSGAGKTEKPTKKEKPAKTEKKGKMFGGIPVPGSIPPAGNVDIPVKPPKPEDEPISGNTPTPGGILIPGGGTVAKGQSVEEEKKKKEKRSLFGGIGFKKKDETLGELTIPAAEKQGINVNKTLESDQNWSGTVMLQQDVNATRMLAHAAFHLKHGERYIPLERFPFTIGKYNTNYIVKNDTVSRLHATITCEGDQCYIQDEGSKNHTYINGMPLPEGQRAALHDGDRIRLSDEEFVYHTK